MLHKKGWSERQFLLMIMPAQKVILINASRLLGDMLRTIIYRSDHLELVQEFHVNEELPSAIEKSEAEWVILSLPSDKSITGWVDKYIAKHPSMRFLAIFPGSSKVKLKYLDYEEDLEDLSLDDLIQVIEEHTQHA